MANNFLTIFQRLQQTIVGNNIAPMNNANSYNIQHNNIIDTATSPEEYKMKKLQAKQQALLAKQWVKANYDITNQSLAGLNDVRLMYRECEIMDNSFPEIGTALDIFSEETTYINDGGFMVNITSKSDRIKSILTDLFVNRLSINVMLPMICRGMCKYGNNFMLLNIDKENGVMGWKQLPVHEMERYENGQQYPYMSAPTVSLNKIDETKPIEDTKFVWVGQTEYTPYRSWQIAHFRLLYDSQFLPYGCIVGDSRIETENGFKPIENIRIGDRVWTFNIETQKRELSTVTMHMNKGVKPVYKLKTNHHEIVATEDHKFLVYDNDNFVYKELKDIKINDLLICDNLKERISLPIKIDKEFSNDVTDKIPLWWSKNINCIPKFVNEDFAMLFGFLLGDGWLSHGCHVMFANGEHNSINDKYIRILCKFTNVKPCFIKNSNKHRKLKNHTVSFGSKMFYTILERMGFTKNKCYKKRIPEWVYKADNNIKKAFIQGIVDADGSYSIISKNSLRINIELCNEQLIKDLKCLVQSVGYKSGNISCRDRIGKKYGNFNVVSRHKSYYFNFYQTYNVQEKRNDVKNRLSNCFVTEKVKHISYEANKETYDITVNNSNSNFFANGIVTHNCSLLHKARRHFRMLSIMEDMMLIYRLDRSIERRIFKVNVGSIDAADVPAYVQEIANRFKRTPIVDPMTGQLDLRKNVLCNTDDFFFPVRDSSEPSPIETLPAGQNLTAMDDINFVQNKVLTALRVPKSFLNFEEQTGDGKNLSLMDVRFTRTVNRIQQALLMELNKIAIIHLFLLGFTDELTNFNLTMNNPSSQAEMLELENLAKKITTAKDAVSDPGGGIPLTSLTWAWKHIMKWSDKEIQRNLEEIRLESALAAEISKTSQIIKRTKIFDNVDNIYGEIDAEYSDAEGENGEQGDGGAMGGGGAPIGGGDMDFGDGDMPADEMADGVNGEMGMEDAAAEDNAAVEGPIPAIQDSVIHKMNMLKEAKVKEYREQMKKKSKHYADILCERLTSRTLNKATDNLVFDKKINSLNEGMTKMIEQLKSYETQD